MVVIYGAQANRIQEELLCTLEEAEAIIESYFAKFHGLKRWLDLQATLAKHQKWVRDKAGRTYFVFYADALLSD